MGYKGVQVRAGDPSGGSGSQQQFVDVIVRGRMGKRRVHASIPCWILIIDTYELIKIYINLPHMSIPL